MIKLGICQCIAYLLKIGERFIIQIKTINGKKIN
jgi:hypothetical protein